jgi:hypothetical protein
MKYFMAQDESCHWYVVRADKYKEWVAWTEPDYAFSDFDPDGYTEFAYRIGGWPGMIHFENPVIDTTGEAIFDE